MRRADLVPLPMHRQRARTQYLYAVHSDIPNASLRIFRDHHRQRDVRTAVLWPAGDYRQLRQVYVVALQNDVLTGRLSTFHARRKLPDLEQTRQHCQLSDQTLRHLQVEHLGDALSDLVQIIDAERKADAAHRSEKIYYYRILRPLAIIENHVLEVQRLAAAGLLHYTVSDLA